MASLGEAAAVRMTAAGAATRSTVAPVARNAWRYGAGPGALVLVGSLAFLRFGLSAAAAVAALVLAVLGLLSAIDIKRRVVPNKIVLPATAVVLLAHLTLDHGRWLEWLVATIATAAFLFVAAMITRDGLGMGDVKLGLLLGAALGYGVAAGLFIGTGAAAVFALALLARRGRKALRTTIPYVPFLAFGAAVALLLPASSSGGVFS